jgi:hypothetical protein
MEAATVTEPTTDQPDPAHAASRAEWAAPGIDLEMPSQARIYDYLLGGSHNFEVDRQHAERMIEVVPQSRMIAQQNRAFLRRAVEFLVGEGIQQFLDLGSGIPTAGNVHDIALRSDPAAKVAYIDLDPVAVAHSRRILADNPSTVVVQADLLDADTVLRHPDVTGLLDFDRPIAILMLSVLHAIEDEDHPHEAVAALGARVCSGSYLAVSHAVAEDEADPIMGIQRVSHARGMRGQLRDRAGIARFFTGFELVEPGLVWPSAWRPERVDGWDPADLEGEPQQTILAGVARKP